MRITRMRITRRRRRSHLEAPKDPVMPMHDGRLSTDAPIDHKLPSLCNKRGESMLGPLQSSPSPISDNAAAHLRYISGQSYSWLHTLYTTADASVRCVCGLAPADRRIKCRWPTSASSSHSLRVACPPTASSASLGLAKNLRFASCA